MACATIRAEGRSGAEIVTQLLFGEEYQILDESTDWIKVRCIFDKYEGFLSRDQLNFSEEESPSLSIVQDRFIEVNGRIYPMGSVVDMQIDGSTSSIVEQAQKLLDSPYLWGGRSFMGIDCSGLVQVVFKTLGHRLPRDAKDQIKVFGPDISLAEAVEGDLAFFTGKSGSIAHVGIVLQNSTIIHASGSVRIDILDEEGIYNEEQRRYTHKLAHLKSSAAVLHKN